MDPHRGAPRLRHLPEYRRWLTGDLLLALGEGIGAFAMPLITLTVTGSLRATALVGSAQALATVAGMIPGGLLADRYDRRRLRLLSGIVGAVLQALLVTVLIAGWAGVAVLLVLAATDRFSASLLGNASGAMLKQIVPARLLPRALAVSEGREASVELVAGPAGGALMAVGLACPPLARLLGSLGVVVSTWRLRGDYRPRGATGRPRPLAELGEAARWVLRQRIRLQLVLVAAAVNLGCNGVMLTVTLDLADRGESPARIGLLTTAFAAAILLGALAAGRLVDVVPTGVLVVVPILLLAAGACVMPVLESMPAIAALYAAMGLGLAPLNAACQGFFLHLTPIGLQGRVGALTGVVALGLMPLAPVIAGWGLALHGRTPTLLVFAAVSLLGAVTVVLGRDLRGVPAAPGWDDYARRRGLVSEEPEAAEREPEGVSPRSPG